MELEVKDVTGQAKDAESTLADAATGVVLSMADAATHPVRTVRREVRKLERKGAPVNRRVDRQVKRAAGEAAEFTEDVIDGTAPERWALTGIRMLKDRARRKDTLGDLLYQGLAVVNGGLERYLKTVQRFESATTPPAKGSGSTSSGRTGARRAPSASRARTSAARARSRTRASARKTTAAARSTVSRARTATRRTATAARKSA